jgi:hypothetical protein
MQRVFRGMAALLGWQKPLRAMSRFGLVYPMDRLATLGLMLLVSWATTSHAENIATKNSPVLDLSDLVVAVLPKHGFEHLGWDYMVGQPTISWQTPGITTTETGMAMRVGFARIRVAGVSSKVLHQGWEELPWSVTLSTTANERFGPKLIEIKPGGSDQDSICFGVTFRGCAFTPDQALKSRKLKSRLVCESSEGADRMEAYAVSTAGNEPDLLVYELSGGSGGQSASLEIRPLSDRADVCKSAQLAP